MLGKCIKNEIVNRYKPICLAYIVLLIYSPIFYLLKPVMHNVNNTYIGMFIGLIMVAYGLVVFGNIILILIYPMVDFRNRVFKDQGYLTNTLPVKTSTMMIGRLIADLLTYISAGIVIPFAICLSEMDFGIYKDLIHSLFDLIGYITTDVTYVWILTLVILVLVTILAGMLLSQWMFNAAYAFGHAFSNHKRVMSIIGMVILYLLFQMLSVLLLWFLSETGIMEGVRTEMVNYVTYPDIEGINRFLGVISIFEVLATAGLVAITSWLTKNKLNLE